jgi:hypothetical protein
MDYACPYGECMNEIPTTTRLADLGCHIDRDGFTAHEPKIAEPVSGNGANYRRELCLDQLLIAWRQHDDARRQGAAFSERMASRQHLDAVRLGLVACE